MSQSVAGLIISPLQCVSEPVEVVERKGLGHPDTICDALAESLSRALSREYRNRFGAILHHNVDKALLCGGRAAPAFGGGAVLEPMNLVLAGRAACNVAGESVPIKEIAAESARGWFKTNLHAMDPDRHVRIEERIQPGSIDLQALFSDHASGGVVRANDTSIGVGYAPLSPLERLVLAVEKHMNGADRAIRHPAWGEDVKIMGVRNGNRVNLTVACAMIGRNIPHLDDYLAEKIAIANLARDLAAGHGFDECEVAVNHADNPGAGGIYLTVTGTSAEAGDDGQVGRGNRINGLITPLRPMSLEAAAGKNPVSHVGKIYNVVAQGIAAVLLAVSPEIARAECLLVSRIGAPVTEPAIVHVRLSTMDGGSADRFRERASEIAADHLGRIPRLVDQFVAGAIDLF